MKKILLFVMTFGFIAQAQADLAVGVLGGVRRDGYQYSANDGSSVDAKSGSTYGALLWLPFLPTLSFRTGILYESRTLGFSSTAGDVDLKETRVVYPVLLELALPLTGLSAIGGLHYATLNKAELSKPGFTIKDPKTDQRLVLGLGYEMASFTLLSLRVEGLYERSMDNFSNTDGVDLKSNSIAANVILKFGF
ncbi:MAG: hypothetical protein KF802_00735 [Bdellovibrionaceae bacterium]|nr:hypothetical protein [Pseudobdellovibrionaceae bacterium]